uniref:Uncharacterized protein n=1 Tax=Anguilla anguilla TaxID=7936 RepID=A0A0E9PA36_ANGAN
MNGFVLAHSCGSTLRRIILTRMNGLTASGGSVLS